MNRLRHLRNEYRELTNDRVEEIFNFKKQLSDLKKQLSENIEALKVTKVYVNSNDETRERFKPIRHNTTSARAKTSRNADSHRNISATNIFRTFNMKFNNKYSDVLDFKNTEDSSFYES